MRFLALSFAALAVLAPGSIALADDLLIAADPDQPAPAPVVATAPPPSVATAPPPPRATTAPRPPKPTPPAPTETRTKFYGWQNILVGELGLGAAIGGAFLGAGEPAALGGLVYLLGGPIVHGVHGSVAKVFGSLGGNVAFPLVGALTGFAIAKDSEDEGQGAAIGALVGCVVAPIFDGVALGWTSRGRSDGVGKSAPVAPPMVGVTRTKHGWTATIAGAF